MQHRPPQRSPPSPPPFTPPSQGPTPKRRLRLTWIFMVGVILFAMYLAAGLTPSFTWAGILEAANILNTERFTTLATLGVIGVVICLVMRIVRRGKDDS